LWNDQRTGKQCEEIHERCGGLEELLKLTNNRMLPGYTGGKILWLRENEPEIYEKTLIFLNPKDYIRFKLTGVYATEVSDASGTGLFDVRKRIWSYDLLNLLDISKALLPACYESTEISGHLSRPAAELLGLRDNIPVAGGGGDAVVQTTGTGLVTQGILGTTIGTAGIAAMALDKCYDNPEGKLQVFCNNMPDKWHTMGVTLAAGGSLRWMRDMLCGGEKEIARWIGRDVYELITAEAERAAPGAEGLLFLPYLIGERCPHPDPNARGGVIGLTLRHDKGSLLRSVMEGVIFNLLDVTKLIEDMGLQVTQIRTSGGGSLSGLWKQIHADIFQNDVMTVSGSAEGGAYGAALVAGTGVGMWQTVEEAAQVVKVETFTPPIKENAEIYSRLYPIYSDLYHSLKNTFDRIAEIYTCV
jgi:xylulokinase